MFSEKERLVPPHILIRRETVLLILSGVFLGSLTMLNILGVSRIIDASFEIFGTNIPFKLTIGVLPYPITFLCTDFISELYGRRRANLIVWVGLILNFWVLFIMWTGGNLPKDPSVDDSAFMRIRELTTSTVFASMIAYLTAQFCDVRIFHFFKRLTKGKHLWLRNNASTLASQLVDSIAVITIAHYGSNAFDARHQPHEFNILVTIILSGYIFKLTVALLDTIPFYIGTKILSDYLMINPNEGYSEEDKVLD